MRLQEIAMKMYSKAVNASDPDNVEQFMNEDNVWN